MRTFGEMMPYIDDVSCYEVAEKSLHAYEAAKAFGDFQVSLSDMPGDPLYLTIPDFHNTSLRFFDYEKSKRYNFAYEKLLVENWRKDNFWS